MTILTPSIFAEAQISRFLSKNAILAIFGQKC
jgi:hypothetical protein